MYCPKCEMEVNTQREEINWVLLIILAIFTAGIGVLIYLAIYFNKPENRCIHCDSICQKTVIVHTKYSTQTVVPNVDRPNEIKIYTKTPNDVSNNEGENINHYCPNCGSKQGNREGGHYCPYCGFNIN